jgi:hypothetical protein
MFDVRCLRFELYGRRQNEEGRRKKEGTIKN